MAPLTQESDASGQAKVGGTPGATKPQPVAVEIPITVNGARTVAGSDKREPFSETSQTVLVFGSGAVIRLAAAVGPGQLLFVTNEKSKKEVVCQVVKSKQNGSAGGYVELKFTEAAVDFWGVRFPGAAPAPATPTPTSHVTPISAASVPAKTLEEKLAELKSEAAATIPEPAKPAEASPVVTLPSVSLSPVSAPAAHASTHEPKLAPVVTMPAPAAAPPPVRVPTLSEFLTQGANGPELSKDRSAAAKTEPRSGEPARAADIQPKLSAPPTAISTGVPPAREVPGLSVALGIKQKPATSALDFDLAAEEVKIPSWLEPLARNSSTADAKAAEPKPSAVGEISLDETKTENQPVPEAAQEQAAAENPSILGEGRAPNFATSLPFGSQTEARGSGKSWKIVLAILAVLIVGAAVWYWYVSQPAKVSASENREVAETSPESVPAPVVAPAATPAPNTAPSRTSNSSAASGTTRITEQPTPNTSTPASGPLASTNREAAKETPAEEPARKPALGQVHLAAPKVARKDASQDTGAADPGLSVGTVSGGDANSLALLGKGKGPTAPVPVGGDVTPAQLISSVPPVYPQLARSQRLAGDVTIDALIDSTGHVSSAKVISGSSLLHQSAIDAVKQWRYHPATLNGQPTSMHLTVTVQFRLQ